MAREKPLKDQEVWDRLRAALDVLGDATGTTMAGDTALTAARRAIVLLQMDVLNSAEREQEPFEGPPGD